LLAALDRALRTARDIHPAGLLPDLLAGRRPGGRRAAAPGLGKGTLRFFHDDGLDKIDEPDTRYRSGSDG
jgi:hypothetical protein